MSIGKFFEKRKDKLASFFQNLVNQCFVEIVEKENAPKVNYYLHRCSIEILDDEVFTFAFPNTKCFSHNLKDIVETNKSLNDVFGVVNVNDIFNKVKEPTSNIEAVPTYCFEIPRGDYLHRDYVKQIHDSFHNLTSVNNSNETSKLKICKIESVKFYYIIIFVDNLEINEFLKSDGFVFKDHNQIEKISML
jgi:hypothetical protein